MVAVLGEVDGERSSKVQQQIQSGRIPELHGKRAFTSHGDLLKAEREGDRYYNALLRSNQGADKLEATLHCSGLCRDDRCDVPKAYKSCILLQRR